MDIKIGDYVISVNPRYPSNHVGKVGKIVSVHHGNTFLRFSNIDYWINKRWFRKITEQEYIIAKLKGKLYCEDSINDK